MTILPYMLAVWLFLVGLYGIVSSRNFIHLVICLSVCQSSTYVLLLAIGYRTHGTAPVFKDIARKTEAVDPVVQSLTLTDIVVSVTISALLFALAVEAHKCSGTLDPEELRPLKG
jgi:multicomponent Na+:H+ antiporter subunit C